MLNSPVLMLIPEIINTALSLIFSSKKFPLLSVIVPLLVPLTCNACYHRLAFFIYLSHALLLAEFSDLATDPGLRPFLPNNTISLHFEKSQRLILQYRSEKFRKQLFLRMNRYRFGHFQQPAVTQNNMPCLLLNNHKNGSSLASLVFSVTDCERPRADKWGVNPSKKIAVHCITRKVLVT